MTRPSQSASLGASPHTDMGTRDFIRSHQPRWMVEHSAWEGGGRGGGDQRFNVSRVSVRHQQKKQQRKGQKQVSRKNHNAHVRGAAPSQRARGLTIWEENKHYAVGLARKGKRAKQILPFLLPRHTPTHTAPPPGPQDQEKRGVYLAQTKRDKTKHP